MVGNGSIEKGKVTGNAFKATMNADVQGNPTTIEMEGKAEGEKINGTLSVPGIGVILSQDQGRKPSPKRSHEKRKDARASSVLLYFPI